MNFTDTLPIDLQNEQVILGQSLNFKDQRELFITFANWDHFLDKRHKVIAWSIIAMVQRELEINDDSFVLVVNDYPDSQDRSYGGNRYLTQLRRLCPTENQNFKAHLEKLKNDYVKSTIGRDAVLKIFQLINNPQVSLTEIEASLSVAKDSIVQHKPIEIEFMYGNALYDHYLDVLKKRSSSEKGTFVTTGFEDLDANLTEGMAKSNVSVITGYTGMAKSALIHNMMIRQAAEGVAAGDVSLEMVAASVMDRMVSLITGIPLKDLIKGTKNLSEEEKRLVGRVVSSIKESERIYINDKATLNLDQIDAQLTLLERIGKPLDVLYIDLFGKLDDVSVSEGLASNIEHKLRLTRAIARKHNVHISCVVQLGRYFDLKTIRPNKPIPRPKIDNIKNSNAFAEECDLLLFLHRNKYYKPDLEHDILEIEIGKQRQGVMGVKHYFEFDMKCTKISTTTLKPDDYQMAQ